MSEMSEKVRADRKRRAEHFSRGSDPHERVDASGYSPPDPLDADVKTGARPISPRLYRRGGKVMKVEGEAARKHAGRKPRKSGGRAELTPDNYVNRDVREANEERDGTKHVGGFKRGGRTHKDVGGAMSNPESAVPTSRMAFGAGPSMMSKAAGIPSMKRGGEAHADEAQDKALIKREVKKDALKRDGRARGGEVHERHNMHGGGKRWAKDAMSHPVAAREIKGAEKPRPKSHEMERSTAKPVRDRPHLAAKLESVSGGELEGTRPTGGRMARKDGGRTGKGKMNVNIVIATGRGQEQPPMPQGAPMPPPGGAPGLLPSQQGMAPGQAAPQAGAPAPAQMPMQRPNVPMMRKAGGRIPDMEYGSGGGEGRLEKIREYGRG